NFSRRLSRLSARRTRCLAPDASELLSRTPGVSGMEKGGLGECGCISLTRLSCAPERTQVRPADDSSENVRAAQFLQMAGPVGEDQTKPRRRSHAAEETPEAAEVSHDPANRVAAESARQSSRQGDFGNALQCRPAHPRTDRPERRRPRRARRSGASPREREEGTTRPARRAGNRDAAEVFDRAWPERARPALRE